MHIDHRKKDILCIGKGPTQDLDDTSSTEEKNTQLIIVGNARNFV